MKHDVFRRRFVYWLPMLQAEFLERLNIRNGYDALAYTFDAENATITFEKYGAKLTYRLRVEPQEGGCLLKLEQTPCFAANYVLKDITPF